MNSNFWKTNKACTVLALLPAFVLAGCSTPPTTSDSVPGATNSNTGASEASAPVAKTKTPKVGETAAGFELTAISGQKVKLAEALKTGPVVLVMLRGFPGYQCPLCTAQFGQLRSKAKEFSAAKARVLLVYPGPSQDLKKRADEFVKGEALPQNFDLLLDPDYKFTNQYGLRWDAKNETSYPATFVLDKTGKVLFAKVSREHGDRSKVEDVLAALRKS